MTHIDVEMTRLPLLAQLQMVSAGMAYMTRAIAEPNPTLVFGPQLGFVGPVALRLFAAMDRELVLIEAKTIRQLQELGVVFAKEDKGLNVPG